MTFSLVPLEKINWSSVMLQCGVDIRKQLKTTTFIIPKNFCFNNIAKKSFPGTPLGQVPYLAVRGRWTSATWSWTSRNNLKQLLSSSPTTFVSTTLLKSHSLGHIGVNALFLVVRGSGPVFYTCNFQISGSKAFIWHLNLEPTVNIEGVSPFFFFTYSNYNIDLC